MRAVTIAEVYSATPLNTRYGDKVLVSLGLYESANNWKAEKDFWLSLSQYERLKKAFRGYCYSCKEREVIAILDEGNNGNEYIKFVFGITPKRSDMSWIEETFNLSIKPRFIELYDSKPVLLED